MPKRPKPTPGDPPSERRIALVAVLLPALLALTGSAALGLWVELPAPRVNDEFSYLLAAETFARGRLANPPPAIPEPFETFQVLVQPTYASKYPPGQGLMLALGIRIAGHPIAGVWLECALLSAALAWALLAWFPARLALLGALAVALRFGIAGYWSQSYWGGALGALGGALLLGATARLVRTPRVRDALALALGLAVLANSRPFEGLLASLPCAVWLAGVWLREIRRSPRPWLTRVIAPLALGLALLGAWMAYYNLRVTGSPLALPYTVHSSQYHAVPLFLFQDLPPTPEYHHEMLRKNYAGLQMSFYEARESLPTFFRTLGARLARLWRFYLGIGWTLPLLALPLVWREAWARLCLAVLAMMGVATSVTTFGGYPHYVGPGLAALMALVVGSIERLARFRSAGRWMAGGLALALLVSATGSLVAGIRSHEAPPKDWSRVRAAIEERLRSLPGRDLVLVRYDPRHNPQAEWVHNGADLDEAEVLWARAMDAARDRALLSHYADRRAWLLEVLPTTWRIEPYPRTAEEPRSESGGEPPPRF